MNHIYEFSVEMQVCSSLATAINVACASAFFGLRRAQHNFAVHATEMAILQCGESLLFKFIWLDAIAGAAE